MKKSLYYFFALMAFIISYVYDQRILKYVVLQRNDVLTTVFKQFTYLGTAIGVVILIIIVFLWLINEKKYIMPLIYGTFISFIFVFLLKMLVARARPYDAIGGIALVSHFASNSFPSLHAAMAFAVLPVIDKAESKFKLIWITFISMIALSRVYLGVHYLSDVIMGAMIGYGITDFFMLSIKHRWFRRINFLEKWKR